MSNDGTTSAPCSTSRSGARTSRRKGTPLVPANSEGQGAQGRARAAGRPGLEPPTAHGARMVKPHPSPDPSTLACRLPQASRDDHLRALAKAAAVDIHFGRDAVLPPGITTAELPFFIDLPAGAGTPRARLWLRIQAGRGQS